LACAPLSGDPHYASVCKYTNQLSPIVTLLNALWFFYSAYQQVLLLKHADKSAACKQFHGPTPGTPVGTQSRMRTAASATNAKPYNFRNFPGLKFMRALHPAARVSIVIGVTTLCSSLWSFIGGSGTAYAPETLRGVLGDTLGKSICLLCAPIVCQSAVLY
jgi:hypothetical protein